MVEAIIAAMKPQISPWILSLLLTGIAASRSAAGPVPLLGLVAAVAGVILFYAGGVSVLNDYFDRDRDFINHSGRPIPSGALSERAVLVLGIGTAILGVIVVSLGLPWEVLRKVLPLLVVIELMHLIYGLYPNLGCLGMARQALLGIGTGLMVLIGGLMTDAPVSTLWLAAALSGAYHFIVFVGKDFADIPGDRERGVYTVPVALGIRTTGALYATGLALVYAALTAAYLGAGLSYWGLPLSITAACLAAYVAAHYLRGESDQKYWSKLMLLGFMSSFAFSGGLMVAFAVR